MKPAEFLQSMFGRSHAGLIYICRLPNIKEQDFERNAVITSGRQALPYLKKWDAPGAAVYFCISTINGGRRNKASAQQCPVINLDLDLDADAKRIRQAEAVLRACDYPPNIIVYSGSGLHAYWLLKPHIWRKEAVDGLRKKIAHIFNGDGQVTHCAALMRLPGSHNSKREGKPKLVTARWVKPKRYDIETLDLWKTGPLLSPAKKPMTDEDRRIAFFAAYGEQAQKAPINVVERLANMQYHGDGDTGVHVTQRDVTASLISRGYDLDGVVKLVLKHTKRAVKKHHWDWIKEEREIRKMAITWMRKKAEMDRRTGR